MLLLLITLLIICVNPFYKVLVPLSLLEYASLFNREPQLNTINLVLKIEGKLAISDDCPVAIQTYIFPFLLNLLSFGNLFSKKNLISVKKITCYFLGVTQKTQWTPWMAECMTAATSGFKWQNTVDLSKTDIVVEVVDDLAVVPGIVVADPALVPAVGLGPGPAADLVPNGEIQDQALKSNLQEEINQDQYLSQDLSLDPNQHQDQDHDQDHKIIAGSYVRIYKKYDNRLELSLFLQNKRLSNRFFF